MTIDHAPRWPSGFDVGQARAAHGTLTLVRSLFCLAFAAALSASADDTPRDRSAGKPVDPGKAAREVAIDMSDAMRFSPDEIVVKRGESIRFVVRNSGKLVHEMVIGTLDDLKEHADMMKKMTQADHHHHHAPNMIEVAPGRSGRIGWQFTHAGEFHYGCLIPGHFDAGMIGKIVVK